MLRSLSSKLSLLLVLTLADGCGAVPVAAPATSVAAVEAARLRTQPLPRLETMRLRLLRALYQAPRVPEFKSDYAFETMYEVSWPSSWRFTVTETRTDLRTQQTLRLRVEGLFNAETLLIKVTKATPIAG